MLITAELGLTGHLRSGTKVAQPSRARGLEISTYPMQSGPDGIDDQVHKWMRANGAATPSYVAAVNWDSIFPAKAHPRNPREPFVASGVVMETLSLSDKPGSATMDVLGGVTGPYVETAQELHSMFLISREGRHVPTLSQLSVDELTQLNRTIAASLQFLDTQNSDYTNFIGMSISPLESLRTATIEIEGQGRRDIFFPRSPVQNLRTVHLHVVSRNEQLSAQETHQLSAAERRMLHEPYLREFTGLLRETVIQPVSAEFPELPIDYAENTARDAIYPKGALLTVSEDTFTSPTFANFARRLTQQLEDSYWQLADTIVDKRAMFEGQVVMRSLEERTTRLAHLLDPENHRSHFAHTSPELKGFLNRFAARLQEVEAIIPEGLSLEERVKSMQRLGLLGPAYNMMYYKQADGRVTLGITPRLFSGASPAETAGFLKRQIAVDTAAFQPILDGHRVTTGRMIASLRRK